MSAITKEKKHRILAKQLEERKDLALEMENIRTQFSEKGNELAVAKFTEMLIQQEKIIDILEEELSR